MELYDIAVIGGGINGAGVARDAAGRGLNVLLAEQNDYASATSSASTKLIHGGLRYLEYHEFRTRYSGLDPHWRRTKCGLHMSEAQRRRVASRLEDGQ
jgi:glycerol-3-phosphate dehydrogenase